MYTIRDEIDEEITMLLHEDETFICLSDEQKDIVLIRLNTMLHHNLYRIITEEV